MKVVLPRPDSPATCYALVSGRVSAHPLDRGTVATYHDGEGSTSLGNYLVTLIGKVCNPDGTGALVCHLVVVVRVVLVVLLLVVLRGLGVEPSG